MNVKRWIVLLAFGASIPVSIFGQTPPPNDNYSNSIVLTGTDLIFSGTLAGATIENFREESYYENWFVTGPTGSVWWNWTAPTDTVLILQVPKYSSGLADPTADRTGICVYIATNGSTSPAGIVEPPVGFLSLFNPPGPACLAIPVSAGTNYQIQLIGNSPATCTFRLLATNAPVIIQQPRSQTVSSNASAVFYILRAGTNQSDFTYQWRFNGTNMIGQNAPMLALTNIDGNMAGLYTVAISNSAGFTVSDPAMLGVSQTNFPITLAAIGGSTTSFVFSVAGELDRCYTLQSSSNLVNWVAEQSFQMEPYFAAHNTSVFYESVTPLTVTVTNLGAQKFFRVAPYAIGQPDAEICVNQLRQIRIAKLLWRRDSGASLFSSPVTTDLRPYFAQKLLPSCPDDSQHTFPTSYGINNGGTEPACEIFPSIHILVDPL